MFRILQEVGVERKVSIWVPLTLLAMMCNPIVGTSNTHMQNDHIGLTYLNLHIP